MTTRATTVRETERERLQAKERHGQTATELQRWRETERESSHFGSSTTPALGGLFRPLAQGGGGGLTRGCALGGAFPLNPVVLELHACRHWLKEPQSFPRLLLNPKEALLLKVAL